VRINSQLLLGPIVHSDDVCEVVVSPGIDPGIVVFLIKNNNNVQRVFGVLQSCGNVENFLQCARSA
jgi:hypothetical protein